MLVSPTQCFFLLPVQEPCYAHLTALRELCIEHRGGSPFAAWHFSLSALPPSLRRLRLRLPSGSVRLVSAADPRLSDDSRPAVPAAPTQLLQVCDGSSDGACVARVVPSCAVSVRQAQPPSRTDEPANSTRRVIMPAFKPV